MVYATFTRYEKAHCYVASAVLRNAQVTQHHKNDAELQHLQILPSDH